MVTRSATGYRKLCPPLTHDRIEKNWHSCAKPRPRCVWKPLHYHLFLMLLQTWVVMCGNGGCDWTGPRMGNYFCIPNSRQLICHLTCSGGSIISISQAILLICQPILSLIVSDKTLMGVIVVNCNGITKFGQLMTQNTKPGDGLKCCRSLSPVPTVNLLLFWYLLQCCHSDIHNKIGTN